MNLSSHLENELSRLGFTYVEHKRSYTKMERIRGKNKTTLELYPTATPFIHDTYINYVSEGQLSEDEIVSLVR